MCQVSGVGGVRDQGSGVSEVRLTVYDLLGREVAVLVNRAHQRAKDVLEKEREVLEKAAKILLEKEVLEGEELREILNSSGKAS